MSLNQFEIKAAYADGGLIRSNPSRLGGTWAFALVGESNTRLQSGSGLILPARWNGFQIENNVTEFFALLQALKALPDGWWGTAFSDNQNTIRRFTHPHRATFTGIPKPWIVDLKDQIQRLGEVRFELLSGHPSKKALKEQERNPLVGAGKSGRFVSIHNVWADKECTRVGAEYMEAQTRGTN